MDDSLKYFYGKKREKERRGKNFKIISNGHDLNPNDKRKKKKNQTVIKILKPHKKGKKEKRRKNNKQTQQPITQLTRYILATYSKAFGFETSYTRQATSHCTSLGIRASVIL